MATKYKQFWEGPEHCQSHFHLFFQVPEDPCYCRHGGGGRSPAVLRISVSITPLLGKPLSVYEFHSGAVMAKFLPFQTILMLLRSWLQTTPPHQQYPELGGGASWGLSLDC